MSSWLGRLSGAEGEKKVIVIMEELYFMLYFIY